MLELTLKKRMYYDSPENEDITGEIQQLAARQAGVPFWEIDPDTPLDEWFSKEEFAELMEEIGDKYDLFAQGFEAYNSINDLKNAIESDTEIAYTV